MKKTLIAILAVSISAVVFAIALTACASSPRSKGPESEIVVTAVTFTKIDIIHFWIKDANGKTIFPSKGDKHKLIVYPNTPQTVTVPVKNGKYTVFCTAYISQSRDVKVDLNYNRANILIKPDIAGAPVYPYRAFITSISTRGNPAVLAKIEAALPKAFAEIDAALSANLKQNATIAIFPPASIYTEYSEIILEDFAKLFVNSGKYTVVEKRRVEELLAEYDFQLSGLVGEKTLGELLGADVIIFSNLYDDGQLSSWAVDTSKRTTLAKSISAQEFGTEDLTQERQEYTFQVTGGTNNEAETIQSFLANNIRLQGKYNVTGTVQQVGRKNMLILNADMGNSGVQSFEYADSLELWLKLQTSVEKMLERRERNVYDHPRSAYSYSQFGTGVNRAEAEILTQLLIVDVSSIPIQRSVLREFRDATRDIEAGEPVSGTRFNFNWSRSGNRNRLDVTTLHVTTRDSKRYSMDYGTQQEFIRKMRGLSIFVLASLGTEIRGFEGYDLSTAPDPARIPANFTKLDRIGTRQGVPMGGFYIGNALVTQREYESVMRSNPSFTRNPTQPVNNVSIIDAMIFCNQMSIRDGLEPAYLIEGSSTISIDVFASGYRLATSEEWIFALDKIEDLGVLAEYVYDGEWVHSQGAAGGERSIAPRNAMWLFADDAKRDRYGNILINDGVLGAVGSDLKRAYETYGLKDGSGNVIVAPVIRLVRPIFDYWKYTSGQ